MNELPKSVRRKYLPPTLSKKDREKQLRSIKDQRIRPKVKSFKSRKSRWTKLAHDYFGIGNTSKRDMAIILSRKDKKRENQLFKGFDLIVKKGEKAYFTSGSRPNQTPQSWGMARLFSVLFGGPSRDIDDEIVTKYNIPLIRKKQKGKGNTTTKQILEPERMIGKYLKGGSKEKYIRHRII